MAYKRRKTYAKKTYTKKYAPKRRKTTYKRRRSAAPREKRLVITFVNAPPGTMVSTATLGKKSGRPVKARY